ncbi:unnamed protein product [Discosporangium mesarthrocarpum]
MWARQMTETLQSQMKRLRESYICTICVSNDVDTILAPCGHMLCSSW